MTKSWGRRWWLYEGARCQVLNRNRSRQRWQGLVANIETLCSYHKRPTVHALHGVSPASRMALLTCSSKRLEMLMRKTLSNHIAHWHCSVKWISRKNWTSHTQNSSQTLALARNIFSVCVYIYVYIYMYIIVYMHTSNRTKFFSEICWCFTTLPNKSLPKTATHIPSQAFVSSVDGSSTACRDRPLDSPCSASGLGWFWINIALQSKSLTSWWFQPIWKILVKLDHFPR